MMYCIVPQINVFFARILPLIQGNILSSSQIVTCKQHLPLTATFSFFTECSMFRMQVTGYKIAKHQKVVFWGGAGEASICISYINTHTHIYIIMLPPKIYLMSLTSSFLLLMYIVTFCDTTGGKHLFSGNGTKS